MERHKKIVVDASVAVKWFMPEKDYERALKIRDSALEGKLEVLAPTLILYEVANALRFHKIYRLSVQAMLRAIFNLREFIKVIEPSEDVWRMALELSMENDISIYDAVYAALASQENIPLITSDLNLCERLRNKVSVFALTEI